MGFVIQEQENRNLKEISMLGDAFYELKQYFLLECLQEDWSFMTLMGNFISGGQGSLYFSMCQFGYAADKMFWNVDAYYRSSV